jgi:hypothetical protein
MMSYEDDCNEYYYGVPFRKRMQVEAAPKFRVGDRVRVVSAGYADGGSRHQAEVGSIDTVTNVGYESITGELWGYYFHEIELAPTIAIGDRVKLKRHFGPHAVDDAGKVRELITKAGFVNAGVDMDPWGYCVFPVEVLETVAAGCAVRKEQPKFKAGDVVRALVDDLSVGFSIGDVFTLSGVSDDHLVFVDNDADERLRPGYGFELVLSSDAPPDHPCIVALVKDGQPRPSEWPHVHASAALASEEAERLATNNPGQEYAVFQRVGARVAEVQYNMKEVA